MSDANRPLSYLEARALCERYAGDGETVQRFWRDGTLWKVEYVHERPMAPEEDPSNLLTVPGVSASVVTHREEIVGPVMAP